MHHSPAVPQLCYAYLAASNRGIYLGAIAVWGVPQQDAGPQQVQFLRSIHLCLCACVSADCFFPQSLEETLKSASEERSRLVKKVERANTEVQLSEEGFKRREETLNMEIRRLQGEVSWAPAT